MDAEKDDRALAIAFPDKLEAIRTRRHDDQTFDELCADFVTIAGLLRDTDDPRAMADITDSLTGLKQDIEAFVCPEAKTKDT